MVCINVFLIRFDKKVFIIKVTLKKIFFCLKPSKSEVVTLLLEILENFDFKIVVYKLYNYSIWKSNYTIIRYGKADIKGDRAH